MEKILSEDAGNFCISMMYINVERVYEILCLACKQTRKVIGVDLLCPESPISDCWSIEEFLNLRTPTRHLFYVLDTYGQ